MTFAIRFLPEDRKYTAHQPVELMLAAASCDIWVEQPCGLKAICGKCRVRVGEGLAQVSPADLRLLTREEIAAGWRLACQLVLDGPAVVEIPEITRSAAAKPFGDPALFAKGFRAHIRKRYLELMPPTEQNQFAVLDQLARALGCALLHADLTLLRDLSRKLRKGNYRVTAVLENNELIDLEPGDTTSQAFGVAVDLGTTTLAAALVDLRNGVVVQAATRLNPQVRYGADVISRIHFAQENREGNEQLHRALLGAVRQMLLELAGRAEVDPAHIYAVVCAGNPTMTHTAVGADVTSLGQAPYVGLWTREYAVKARELNVPVNQHARLRFLPMIRSHVGSDAVASALAAGLDESEGWRLLIDLGTNSEVVLGCRRRLVATSTAAGPAFEGANITCGMRAAPGAIDAVHMGADGSLVVHTVGNDPARGLSGSGLIDAVAELLRAGVIAPSGFLRAREDLAGIPPALLARCTRLPDGQAAVVLDGSVLLTAQDVRQLQLVKGSIRAGVELLLRHCGVSADDLEAIDFAGAFGSFLRKTSLQAIGLVPAVDPEKVRFIGNAAGVGTRMVLVDAGARCRAQGIAEHCEYVELAGHPDYESAFCAAIPFPEGVEPDAHG